MLMRAIGTMLLKTICAIWICSLSTFTQGKCTDSYRVRRTCYRRKKTTTRCFIILWCTKYKTVSYNCDSTAYRCCANWTGTDCSRPLCFGTTNCPEGGTCISPDLCACPPGFLAPKCQDINECSNRNGGCKHICTDTHGSFKCSCSPGYSLAIDSQSCIDINECSHGNGGCQHICTNTHGSFKCSCSPGYSLAADSQSCIDDTLLVRILVPNIGVAVLLGIVAAIFYALLKRNTRKMRVSPENEVPYKPPRVFSISLMENREPSMLPEVSD